MPDLLAAPVLRIIPTSKPLVGRIRPPGSKSITNRLLLLAGLAEGVSHLSGALKSDDTAYMAKALSAMGVGIDEPDDTSFRITASGRLRAPDQPLFLGNAGTATRFLTAAAGFVPGITNITGDDHMQKRPIRPLLDALSALGVETTCPTGCPPVTIHGRDHIDGGRVMIDAGLSSQYVSAILMAAPMTRNGVEVMLTGPDIGARGYVDLTLAAMAQFGVQAKTLGPGHWHVPGAKYHAADVEVEPDASAATYLWAAEILTGGKIDLGRDAKSFSQPDAAAAKIISTFPYLPAIIDGSQMQDAVPTLAIVAAFANNPVRFTGIANLRVKECDRIHALSTGLNRIAPGLAREEGDDLIIYGQPHLAGQKKSARIDTFNDHRIAMSFALAGLLIEGIEIENPACVAKTYPHYFDDLARLGVQLKPVD